MASLVEELNELLSVQRGEAEALQALANYLAEDDPDLEGGAFDALETATWTCEGLYSRILQLGGTPTQEVIDLAERIADLYGAKDRIKLVCKTQKDNRTKIKSVLRRDDLDDVTRLFLEEALGEMDDSLGWCKMALDEWKVDA